MIETVLEKTSGNTKVVVELGRVATVVYLLNVKRAIACAYYTGGLLESERYLNPRELSEITNLCEWIANKVISGKVKSKLSVAVVAEGVIERLYTEQEEDGND